MTPKHPRQIVDRWYKTGTKTPEYVGEWHAFIWPSASGEPGYITMYQVNKHGQFIWACSCRGYLQSKKPLKDNGDECHHIRELEAQVKEAM